MCVVYMFLVTKWNGPLIMCHRDLLSLMQYMKTINMSSHCSLVFQLPRITVWDIIPTGTPSNYLVVVMTGVVKVLYHKVSTILNNIFWFTVFFQCCSALCSYCFYFIFFFLRVHLLRVLNKERIDGLWPQRVNCELVMSLWDRRGNNGVRR